MKRIKLVLQIDVTNEDGNVTSDTVEKNFTLETGPNERWLTRQALLEMFAHLWVFILTHLRQDSI